MQPTQRTPLLSAILQDYALRRRVFYQKKRAFSCNSLVATASEKLPRIYFQEDPHFGGEIDEHEGAG